MGKKVKKKARSGQKDKRVSAASPKIVSQQSIPSTENVNDKVSNVKAKRLCPHLDKGVDLDKFSSKIGSAESVRCEDCREDVVDRRTSKGKGKHGKKSGGGSKPESKTIWVCLECGHFSCGGAGFPTTPQSHAVRHAKQYRHPLAVRFENPNLRWCFPCDTLIPAQISEENGEQKDALSDIVKIIKTRPSSGPSLDVEDVWFASGNSTSEPKSENALSSSLEGNGGYMIRGLANLGNTCFFNSVLQNLLALSKFRVYLLRLDGPLGPLTISLKKLFIETSPAAGSRNIISPRNFFGCLCAKAPQFKGYQQHDSHELLRCLLDGLYTEDSCARKQVLSSEGDGITPKAAPNFIDAIFGGQISSTVSCLECGHASVVYEPFLDLSLPLPTKRSFSKKAPAVSRAKKQKLPPKRTGRFRPKNYRDSDSSTAPSVLNFATTEGLPEKSEALSGHSTQSQFVNGSALQNLSVPQGLENKDNLESTMEEAVISSDSSAWLDFIETNAVSNDHGTDPQCISISVPEDTGKEFFQHDVSLQGSLDSCGQIDSISTKEMSLWPDDLAWMDYLEPGTLSNDHGMVSQIDNVQSVQDSGNSKDAHSQVDYVDSNGYLGNSWEDEQPLQVQESEVLLLPYKDVASTAGDNDIMLSSVSCEPDSLDFDGFGGLFDEPEASAGPRMKPSDTMSEANGIAETGVMVSESDPDEVDNTDSPVSVESCLAYFTNPEVLTRTEHAWHCEQCSKSMLEQRMRRKKDLQKSASENVLHGGQSRISYVSSGSGIDCALPNGFQNLGNGNTEREILGSSDENSVLQNGKGDQNCITSLEAEPSQVASELEEGGNGMNHTIPEQSQSSSSSKVLPEESLSCQASDSCSVNEPGSSGCRNDNVRERKSQRLARQHQVEESEDEEMDSRSIKVARDATKRILIDRAPPILTIHLKRFSQDARGRLNKLNGHVVFKEAIDLKPYMDPRCADRDKHKYRLFGVVEHLGTMRGGHYVAYIRGGDATKRRGNTENEECSWYHASDAYVREVSLEEVLRCEAYILFYEAI